MSLVSSIQEIEKVLNLRAVPEPVLKNFNRFNAGITFAVKATMGYLEIFHTFSGKTVSPEPNLVD